MGKTTFAAGPAYEHPPRAHRTRSHIHTHGPYSDAALTDVPAGAVTVTLSLTPGILQLALLYVSAKQGVGGGVIKSSGLHVDLIGVGGTVVASHTPLALS